MQPSTQLLTFELDEQRFGIPMSDIQEIIRAVAFARLPKAPQVIEGVLNLRGAAVPVIDVRARFGLAPKPVETSDHLIIARAGSRTVAIRVDRVTDLIAVVAKDIEDIGAVTARSRYVAGVAKLPNGIVIIYALSTFLNAAESADLERSLQSVPA